MKYTYHNLMSISFRCIQGLVLDLRGNPGGLLTSAVDVSTLFVPNGSDIVSARGRGFPETLYRSKTDPILNPNTKLAVLVNEQTASAAEIVSGKCCFNVRMTLSYLSSFLHNSVYIIQLMFTIYTCRSNSRFGCRRCRREGKNIWEGSCSECTRFTLSNW